MPDLLDRLNAALEGRYELQGELGEGGMATVYLAQDLKHNRQVAIKVLRPELAASVGAERFLREIEIAANLNHPHILALFDSGEADGFLYYVMPLVGGDSLKKRLDVEGELPISDAVRVLRHVVDALAYSHGRGVVHRDIKPSNVMLSGRHAVITDFGVAKAVWEASGMATLTDVGVALGTPAYMSPEQAAAESTVDHRADIYSVGVLAYHLLTGRRPFEGSTPQAQMAARLTRDPEPVRKHRAQVPLELESLVMRCLEKKPADRWQSADEMLPYLEALERPTGALAPIGRLPWGRKPLVAVLVGAATMVAAVALTGRRFFGEAPFTITTGNMVQVTNEPGLEFQPALSPDGREVAYVDGPIMQPRIVHRSAVAVDGGEVRLTESLGGFHWYPSWTPDGESLRFAACLAPRSMCTWRQVGRLGGSIGTLSLPVQSSLANSGYSSTTVAWSTDGARGAFAPSAIEGGQGLFTFDSEDPEPQLLAAAVRSAGGVNDSHSLAWSPNGRWIAFVQGNSEWGFFGNPGESSIWMVATDGGDPIQITDESSMNVSPQWLPDSRHLLFVSDRDGARGVYVVEMGPDGPVGEPHSVLSASDPHSISVSEDGRNLAYAKFNLRENLRAVPIPERGVGSLRDARRVTTGNQIVSWPDVSADGRELVFSSNRRGDNLDIYGISEEGGTYDVLVDYANDVVHPSWSPDGTELVFIHAVSEEGRYELDLVPVRGGAPVVLAAFSGDTQAPKWSSDGLSVAFQTFGNEGADHTTIWTVSRPAIGGPWGDPVEFPDHNCYWPEWSPTGDMVMCWLVPGSRVLLMDRRGEALDTLDAGGIGIRPRVLSGRVAHLLHRPGRGRLRGRLGAAPDRRSGHEGHRLRRSVGERRRSIHRGPRRDLPHRLRIRERHLGGGSDLLGVAGGAGAKGFDVAPPNRELLLTPAS